MQEIKPRHFDDPAMEMAFNDAITTETATSLGGAEFDGYIEGIHKKNLIKTIHNVATQFEQTIMFPSFI